MTTNRKDKETSETKVYNLENTKEIFDTVFKTESIGDLIPSIKERLNNILLKYDELKDYKVLFLYDEYGNINPYTSNKIYSVLSDLGDGGASKILMIVHSGGGVIEPAYLISKTCKEYANDKFIVSIPRQAKSAATLLALGADEIHMGMMSELGPIDPQIGKYPNVYPALGLGYALEHVATLASKYPASSEMFAKYLSLSLDLKDLGYLERVSESAAQYAERLIKDKKLPDGMTPQGVAGRLVYSYKDHGFVIDKDEALTFLGKEIIKYNTTEYKLANEMHKFLELITLSVSVFKKLKFSIIGDIESGISFAESQE